MSSQFISSAGLSSAKEPRLMKQKKLSAVLGILTEWLALAAVVIVPLAFMINTTQSQDFIKQVALLAIVSIAALCWVGSMLIERSLSLRRSVANPLVLVLLAAVLVSALFSGSRYVGLVGGNGQEYQSFITTLLFAAFFFVIVNLPKESKFPQRAIFAATIVGGLVSLVALFQFAGVSLVPGVSVATFNLVGSTVVLGLYAATTIVLAAASFLIEKPDGKFVLVKNIAIGFFGVCALLLAATVDFWPIWTAVIVGLIAVLILAVVRPQTIGRLGWLAVPMIVLVVAVLLLVVDIPLPIHAPTEIFPSLAQSFDVARGTLVNHPIFGAGPGTFAQEFALHRSLELNQNAIWYVQFDRGMSYLTTIASNLGVAGLVAWLAVIIVGVWKSAAHLIVSRKKNDEAWVFGMVVSVAWLTTAAGIIFYGASLSLLLLFWLLFALLIRMTADENIELSFKASPRSGLVLTFSFVILIVLSLAGWFISGARLYSDSSLTAATAMDANTKDDAVIRNLENALRIDPQSDTIARNLSQAYLIKIQQLFNDTNTDATAKGTQVENLTAAAIKAATAATELGRKNIQNWSQLGAVYEAIASYVSNAPDQAIAAYGRAADLDPTSPVHPTNIGRVYLSMAGAVMNGANDSKDEAAKTDARKKSDELLVRSLASLEKALSLKSDYAPASYQISIVYDAQGKIDEARSALESVVKLSPTFANARWLLAMIYEEKQEYDSAIAQIEAILTNNPDNKDVQNKLQILQDKKAGKAPAATVPAPATLP